jgi:hypothetical protein
MNVLIVVNHARDWPFDIDGARVVTAREYLTDPAYAENTSARIINLCRTDRYQGRGYYVSLLAEARGHRALPEVKTLGDLQARHLDQLLGNPFIEQLQRALANCDDETCIVDAWFGRDPTRRNESLAQQLFATLRIPLLQAEFERIEGMWRFRSVRIVSPHEIPAAQHALLVEAATDYLRRGTRSRAAEPPPASPAIAILFDADEPEPPSNAAALEKFTAAARALGMRPSFIGRDDIDRLDAFDGLFIRDTTNVNHYTYQFARRAAAGGLVVVDDPDSILKCTNKVYLNELLSRHNVPVPKTLIVHRDNVHQIVPALGPPAAGCRDAGSPLPLRRAARAARPVSRAGSRYGRCETATCPRCARTPPAATECAVSRTVAARATRCAALGRGRTRRRRCTSRRRSWPAHAAAAR